MSKGETRVSRQDLIAKEDRGCLDAEACSNGSDAVGIAQPYRWRGHSAWNNRWFTATVPANCSADRLIHPHQ